VWLGALRALRPPPNFQLLQILKVENI